jgi:hypothetical protein
LSIGGSVFTNVRDAGALGDGTTDDSAAIQSAIDSVNSAGGGIVFFPAGTYGAATSINLKAKVSLMGAGRRVSMLKALSGITTAVVLGTTGNSVTDVIITDLGVDGNFSGGPSVGGIQCTAINRIQVRNCYVTSTGTAGIVIQSSSDKCTVVDNVIENTGLGSASSGFGIRFTNSTQCEASRNRVIDSAGVGISVGGSTTGTPETRVIGNWIRTNGSGFECIIIDTLSDRSVVEGNICMDGDDQGINIAAKDCAVVGNTVSGASRHGILVTGINCTLTGNICKNSSQEVSGSTYGGISIQANGAVASGNRCYDDQGTKTQNYGIKVTGTLSDVTITGNSLAGNLTAAITGISDGINDCVVANNSGVSTVSTITTTTTLSGERVVFADATSAAFTVTLPDATTAAGKRVDIKRINSGSNVVTVGSAGGTIDGASTFSLSQQYESITVVSDGTNWEIV